MFNLGIEVGQLPLVAVVLLTMAALDRLPVLAGRCWVRLVPAYAIGSLAIFWILQRI